MLIARVTRRCMHNLAAKYVGGEGHHVVDPNIDLRCIFDREEDLKRSIEERRLQIDINTIKNNYLSWYKLYEKFTAEEKSVESKKDLREAKNGLLEALRLPNFVHSVGNKEKAMLKPTKHTEYLCAKGLMRIDKENEVVSLVGYPVTLQNQIKNQLFDLFVDAQLISPSYFVRAAILEALNVNNADFLSFHDGSSTFPKTYVVGHSLASHLSPFIRTAFTEKNTWPITLQSSGMGYHAKRNTINLAYARQRLKHCVLSMGTTTEHSDHFISTAIANFAAFLDEGLFLDVKARVVQGKELRNYESQAVVFEDKGLELTRISRMDDYVSRRLNICAENGQFLNLVYAETDIDRVIARLFDGLIDGSQVPKLLRNAMTS